ncbi:hypothetical protein EI77_01964 [Prosthecobacter fusiformis]|uniref:Transmembrane protein n=1 Tax=Prosthecobacter fusiformis TaxID=48464 RepID=A0A4R7S088_9BACT|nr:hypothetical protein [Prosthecobacter fusiformis]TDU70846.1 hypothetical protein EI77_01964 [Prosthecobacter fusiformis]
MIVPEFWAEGRVKARVDDHQVTVRRFGWSDVSQEEAQALADERAMAALREIAAGEMVEKYEPKLAYNGAEGVPIREEILARHGEAVITRNLYGARCLNTPDVLFADVDYGESVPMNLSCTVYLVLVALSAGLGVWQWSVMAGVVSLLVSLVVGSPLALALFRAYEKIKGGTRERAHERIRQFSRKHPDWHLRVYETPKGLRILVMHATFGARDEAVQDFFQALDTDPVYVRMCRNQHCFRARLSPKPWRIGIREHIRPRPGYWPVKPEHLPARNRWIAAYEEKARGFAACRFLEQLGSETVHPTADAIRIIHDELCQANTTLKIA